jgi:hypothetical protein
VYDREKVLTIVYVAGGITYLKRFAFGGPSCTRVFVYDRARVLFFSDESGAAVRGVRPDQSQPPQNKLSVATPGEGAQAGGR